MLYPIHYERYFEMTTATQTVNKISEEAKLLMAVESIKHPDMTIKGLAEMFRVSETSVRRAVKNYAQQAEEFIAAQQGEQEPEVIENPPTGKRGFKPRNGRWAVLDAMFDELGFEMGAKEQWMEANKRSIEAGLKPLNRNTFYAMRSIAKKARGL